MCISKKEEYPLAPPVGCKYVEPSGLVTVLGGGGLNMSSAIGTLDSLSGGHGKIKKAGYFLPPLSEVQIGEGTSVRVTM